MASRVPIVGVLGSGSAPHAEQAAALGAWLAAEGVHLVTGGGGGVMKSVSHAFARVQPRRGLVIGILPGDADESGYRPRAGYPNPWVEVPIRTHLPLSGTEGTSPLSRNHINVLTADVLVALPGSHGTASEVRLALRYGQPLVAWLPARSGGRDAIPGLPAGVPVERQLAGVQAFVRRHLPPC